MQRHIPGIDAIGHTAFMVAALRAAEHRNPQGLFSDPYAAHFLHAAGADFDAGQGPHEPGSPGFAALMQTQAVVRTRFFDDHLLAAARRDCRQVVLVASGMDSRPWRLPWPTGTRVFEIDQEPVLRFKDEVMEEHGPAAATAIRRQVAVDLREDWPAALRSAGFADDRPTAWLVEGVLYSLDAPAADHLLAALTRLSATGSTLAFDHFEVGPSLRAATDRISPDLTSLWQSGPADPDAWLRRHGWRPDVHELADVAAGFGLQVHPAHGGGPQAEGRSWLATATQAGGRG